MSHAEFNFYPWNCAPDLTNSNLNASTATEKCFTDLELVVQQRSSSIAGAGIKAAVVFKAASPRWAKSSWQTFCSSASVEPPFLWSFAQDGFWHVASNVYFSSRGIPGLSLSEEYCCTWCWVVLDQSSAWQEDQAEHWYSATFTLVVLQLSLSPQQQLSTCKTAWNHVICVLFLVKLRAISILPV